MGSSSADTGADDSADVYHAIASRLTFDERRIHEPESPSLRRRGDGSFVRDMQPERKAIDE